jgi:hypothetical protein
MEEIETMSLDERVSTLVRSGGEVAAAQQQLRKWLLDHGTEDDRLLLVEGPLGLVWLSSAETGHEIEADASPLVSAVRHADQRLADHIHYYFRDVALLDYPFAVPSDLHDATGRWAKQYLKTVAWWGPKPEDAPRARRLVSQVGPGAEYVAGYDPWNRLVLHTGDAFVVEWPLGPRISNSPDDAVIIAQASDQFSTPVFMSLNDGRLDLLPAALESRRSLGFSWGYGGAGPHNLARALHQLLAPPSMSEYEATWDAIYDLVVHSKSRTFRASVGDLRLLLGGDSTRTGSE